MNGLARTLARRKRREIARLMPPGADTLLDYGCGSGTWIRMLRSLDPPWRIIGADIAVQAIEALRRDGFEAHVCDDSEALERIEPGSVGVIHLFHVIEHVPSPLRLLRVLRELLVPGGVVLGQTPNIDCAEARIFGDAWNQWHVPRHFTLFDMDTLRRHAEKAGFEVVSIRNSLSAATQWAGSFTKRRAMGNGHVFRGVHEPLYPPLILASLPVTAAQMALGLGTSHQDFLLRKLNLTEQKQN